MDDKSEVSSRFEVKIESEGVCRLCARRKDDCIDVLNENAQNLLQKIKEVLKVKVSGIQPVVQTILNKMNFRYDQRMNGITFVSHAMKSWTDVMNFMKKFNKLKNNSRKRSLAGKSVNRHLFQKKSRKNWKSNQKSNWSNRNHQNLSRKL